MPFSSKNVSEILTTSVLNNRCNVLSVVQAILLALFGALQQACVFLGQDFEIRLAQHSRKADSGRGSLGIELLLAFRLVAAPLAAGWDVPVMANCLEAGDHLNRAEVPLQRVADRLVIFSTKSAARLTEGNVVANSEKKRLMLQRISSDVTSILFSVTYFV